MADHNAHEDTAQAGDQPRSVDAPFDVVGCIVVAVLAVIVTIAVLTLLGPSIGNVFSNVIQPI